MKAERGAAAVELAMVAIILVILVFGVIDTGRAIFTRIAVIDAAQEGAVFAAFEDEVAGSPLSETHIVDRVIAAVDTPVLTADDIEVTCYVDNSGSRPTYEVEVEVTSTIDMVTPVVGDWFGSLDLVRSARATRYIAGCPSGVTEVTP